MAYEFAAFGPSFAVPAIPVVVRFFNVERPDLSFEKLAARVLVILTSGPQL
jgi:hypothetical protein